jgi:hypothetical protein
LAVSQRRYRAGRPQPGQIFLGYQVRGLDLQHLPVLANRLIPSAATGQDPAQLVMGVGIQRPQSQRLTAFGHRLVEPSLVSKNKGEAEMCLLQVGIDLDRRLLMGNGLVKLPAVGQGEPQQVVRHVISGITGQRMGPEGLAIVPKTGLPPGAGHQ